MSTFRSLIFTVLLLARLASLHAGDGYPEFSWDRVPVYAHVGKAADDFTAEQLDFLANHFNFIAIEKGQAVRRRGDTEAGFAEAARQIKQRNPRAKVLFYWNAFLDYPLYKANRKLSEDWLLKDRRGQPVLVRQSVPAYDKTRGKLGPRALLPNTPQCSWTCNGRRPR